MAHIQVPSLRVTENCADFLVPIMSVLSALHTKPVPPHGSGTMLSLLGPAEEVRGRGPTASSTEDHPPTLLPVNPEGMRSVRFLPVSPTLLRVTCHHDSHHPPPAHVQARLLCSQQNLQQGLLLDHPRDQSRDPSIITSSCCFMAKAPSQNTVPVRSSPN